MTAIYLDNNATTRVAPEVLEAMLPYYQDLYGNPSSAYLFGGQVGRKIQEAREQVATLLGAMPEEPIFSRAGLNILPSRSSVLTCLIRGIG